MLYTKKYCKNIGDIFNIIQKKIMLTENPQWDFWASQGSSECNKYLQPVPDPISWDIKYLKGWRWRGSSFQNVCSILSWFSPFLGTSYFASTAERHIFQLSTTVMYQIVAMIGEYLLLWMHLNIGTNLCLNAT